MIKKISSWILYIFCWLLILGVPRISKITCVVQVPIEGNNQIFQEVSFCEKFKYLEGRSLFFTDFEKTPLYQEVVMDEIGQVYRPHTISLTYPNQLKISFFREEPLFRVKTDNQTFLVNSARLLVADQVVFDIPTVEINQEFTNSFRNGEKVPEEIFQMIASLVIQLKKQQLTKTQIHLEQQGFIINIGREKYLIELNKQLAMTIAKTKLIHEHLEEITQEKFGPDQKLEIDMRFDMPVIRAVSF